MCKIHLKSQNYFFLSLLLSLLLSLNLKFLLLLLFFNLFSSISFLISFKSIVTFSILLFFLSLISLSLNSINNLLDSSLFFFDSPLICFLFLDLEELATLELVLEI